MQNWLDADHPAWGPPKKKRARDEEALQRSVAQYLRLALPPDACFLHIPNHGRRGTMQAALLTSMGQFSGAPDLLVVYRGRALFIELKSPHGSLNRTQKAAHRRLLAAGADVCLCRSLEQVEQSLRESGVRLRATTGGAPT